MEIFFFLHQLHEFTQQEGRSVRHSRIRFFILLGPEFLYDIFLKAPYGTRSIRHHAQAAFCRAIGWKGPAIWGRVLRRRIMRRVLGSIFVLTLLVAAGYSQTFRGAINGTVNDPTGAMVSGANVRATNVATGVTLATTTTSDGQFAFQDIPVGTYKIAVSAGGFSSVTTDNVTVTAGNVYTLPVRLKVGEASTTVEVSAASLSIDTTSATQDNVIPTQAVQDVPMNGRDFTQFIAVQPGYSGYSVG